MDRTIPLEGCFNFRDLGGYPTTDDRIVGWRRLYRSDGLQHLTESDVAVLCDELSLGEIIDLRSSSELRADGRGLLEQRAVRFHHMPLFDGRSDQRSAEYDERTATLADRYFFLADLAKSEICRVLTVLAETSHPAVYHCAAGKDRTGVISAIVLSLLGVRDEIIVADYAASRENLDSIIERLMSSQGYKTILGALPADTLHAEPETMVSFLEQIGKRYGSMREYALAAGVSSEQVERLRDRLLVAAEDA